MRTKRCLASVFATVAMALVATGGLRMARADDWKLAYEEGFASKDWPARWTLVGSVGPTEPGEVRSGGTELLAWVKQELKAPAIRVEYEARMAAADRAGKISDLSCFIGASPEDSGTVASCGFQFGAEDNTESRITFPGMTTAVEKKPLIEMGKWHRIVAEVNGRAASLTVDDKRVATALLPKDLPAGFVRLYSWAGMAEFRKVKVYTKQEADPVSEGMKAAEEKRLVDPPQELKPWRQWSVPPVSDVKPSSVARQRVALTVGNPSAYSGPWPITIGLPIPKDTLWDIGAVRIVDGTGKEVPTEARVAATWTKGGAIRWAHLDFQPTLAPKSSARYVVELGREVKRLAVPEPVRVTEDARSITAVSGALKLVVSKKRGSLIEAAWLDLNGNGAYEAEEQVVRPEGEKGSYFVTAEGDRYTTTRSDSEYSATIESAGPMRAVIRTRGWYQNEKGDRAGFYVNRLYLYRGRPDIRLVTTWVNTVDTDKFKFRDLATHFPVSLKRAPRMTLGPDAGFGQRPFATKGPSPAVAVQATRHEGFIRQGDRKATLKDAGGWADLSGSERGLTVAVFDMAQQWPNALEARTDEIVFHGFSNEGGHNLDFSFDFLKRYWGEERCSAFERLRGSYPPFAERIFNACGLAKTHELRLRFHGRDKEEAVSQWAEAAQRAPIAYMDPAWVCASGTTAPIHPYDPAGFAKFEESLSRRFDEFLDVLDRLTPVYGFYDYGMGVPHYISSRQNTKGETEWVYTAYRREYDLGYGNPITPWLLFLRSGDGRYYRYGLAFSRHCMDAHAHHWTNPRLKKQIGWTIADHGSWVYDSLEVSFTFNNWMEYLLLNYYITGYERAMDVAVQFADAYYEEAVTRGRPLTYCASAGVWHGNAALMYRATWEESYRKLYEVCEKMQLDARCPVCGSFAGYPRGTHGPNEHGNTDRPAWREYGLYHGGLVPGHHPDVDTALARLGELDLRLREGWEARSLPRSGGLSSWAAYQQSKDPRLVRVAQIQMEAGAPELTNYAGLSPLLHVLTWQTLACLPGAEGVEPPVVTLIPRVETMPLFLRHVAGKETRLMSRRALRAFDDQEKDVTAQVVTRDEVFRETHLVIPEGTASGIYRVAVADPSSGVWSPFSSLTFTHAPDLQFMLGAADGIEAPRIWVSVPAGVGEIQVSAPGSRRTVLAFQEGPPLEGQGPVWRARFNPADRSRLASLTQEPAECGFFKVFGAPAYATLRKEAAFEMPGDLQTVPDPAPSDPEIVFVDGAFGTDGPDRALQVNAADRLEIPLGDKVSESRRTYLDSAEGTVEFFVRLNTNPDVLGAEGLPIRVPLDDSVPRSAAWIDSLLRWEYKSSVMLGDGVAAEVPGRLCASAWDHASSPTVLRAGKWYHLALVWRLNDKERLTCYTYLNGMPYPMGDFDLSVWDWRQPALKLVLPGPALHVGAFPGMRVTRYDLRLDELRISDIIRYPHNNRKELMEFQSPAAPFQPDAHTLLLFHFDGDTVGLAGPDGKRVEAKFENRP